MKCGVDISPEACPPVNLRLCVNAKGQTIEPFHELLSTIQQCVDIITRESNERTAAAEGAEHDDDADTDDEDITASDALALSTLIKHPLMTALPLLTKQIVENTELEDWGLDKSCNFNTMDVVSAYQSLRIKI